jgi:predicted nucleotide-binding protein
VGKRVFVIYGRDVAARDELLKLIRGLGLDDIPFESVANSLGPAPFVGDVVLKGLQQADAIVALFTPDEQAVLREPETGMSLAEHDGGERWQARPNVIFEAGIAYGRSDKEPILAVLGTDVRLFSDLAGIHFVRLDASDGKRNMRERLERILGPLEPIMADWESSPQTGDFRGLVRPRWRYFDEIGDTLTRSTN